MTAELDALTSWHADWRGLRAVVLGMGATGFAAADTLAELGADVLVVAERVDDERRAILDVLGIPIVQPVGRDDIPSELGAHRPQVAVVSPGYHPDHPLLTRLAADGVPIWGDIELAWRVRDKVEAADWVLVTGTNGKTTTTRMVGHMLRTAGMRAVEVGNIGTPVLDAVRRPEGFDALVVELSSYQLHWLPLSGPGALAPVASVCLNVADDHLDWHGSREAYEAAKGRVYANTEVACVYNRAEPATTRMVEEADVAEGCRAIGIGLDAPGPSDLGIVDGIVVDRAFLAERRHRALELTTVAELAERALAAPHLLVDALAASALARAAGAAPEAVHDALASFRVDPHRTELVAVADGVAWVDDSKATNPHAADAALSAADPVVWIVGGLLKGVDVSSLIARHAKRLRGVIVIGVDRDPILEALGRHAPGVAVAEVVAGEDVDVMPEAVRQAAVLARPGDTVLLAPAAASMDQFADYADRGMRFQRAVRMLTGGAPDVDAGAATPDAVD